MYFDVIVIGGGQAGLAMGYWLKQSTFSYLIVDKQESVGETWKNRYDSLVLFTPGQYNTLPGLSFPGEQRDYPSKDDVASYLQQYARTFHLPIQNQTCVQNVSKIGGVFSVKTDQGLFTCQNLIIATGPFQTPIVPDFSNVMSKKIVQLHSSEYKNRTQLQDGNVLVVGGGNSGSQITSEIARERTVHLSISEGLTFMPLSVGNKSIFWCKIIYGMKLLKSIQG